MKLSAIVALAAALMPFAAHAEFALTTRATDLQAQPQSDAAKQANLAENVRVDVLQRRGAWSEVKTSSGQTGWVRMLNLRIEADAAGTARSSASGSNAVASLGSLLTGGRSTSSGTATTGVRGLSEEDLQNASPRPEEMQKAQSFAADKTAAQDFARKAGLTTAKIDYVGGPLQNKGGK